MAVVSAGLSHTTHGSISDDGVSEHTDVWRVICDSMTDTDMTVLADPSVPQRGDSLARNPAATGRSVSAERDGESRKWLVTVKYSSAVGSGSSGGTAGGPIDRELHPLLRRPKIGGGFTPYQKPMQFALDENDNKKAVVNSCGQPFDDVPEVEYFIKELEVTTNLSQHNEATWDHYHGRVNATEFRGKAAETVRVLLLRFDEDSEDYGGSEVVYYPHAVRFEWNPDGWRVPILDTGYYEKGDSSADLVRIVDDAGGDIVSPVPLNGGGGRLTAAQIDAGEFVFLENSNPDQIGFRYAYRADFAPLVSLLRF